jgi:hypothetical protein
LRIKVRSQGLGGLGGLYVGRVEGKGKGKGKGKG